LNRYNLSMRHFHTVIGRIVITLIALVCISPVTAADAETLLEGIPEEGQQRYDALQERAVGAQEESRYEDALFFYEHLQEMAPESGEIRYNRGTLHLEGGDFDRAILLFAEAEELGFNESVLYYNRGNAHFHQDEYGRAAEEYRKGLDRDPEDPDILNNLGLAELQLGNLEAAEEYLLRAGAADESFPEPFFHLASVYEMMDEDLLMAEDALTEALRRDETFVEGYYNRGVLRYTREEFRPAFEDFLTAHELAPDDLDILHNLGLSALAVANSGNSRDSTETDAQ
jgi:tetratricopeptide (TPR) repeat protein